MKKKIYLATALALATGLSQASDKYDLEGRFGIGGGAGWAIPILGNDFDEEADEDFTYNFHGKYHFTSPNALEFNFSRYDFEGNNIGAKSYDLMFTNSLSPRSRFTTILGLGAGAVDFSNLPQEESLKLALKARAGFQYALSQDIYATALVDYVFINKMPGEAENLSGEVHALAPQMNLTFYFGAPKEKSHAQPAPAPAPVPVVAAVVPGTLDSDADGVIDAKDKCPGTEAGMEVNGYGCKVEEKANIKVEVLFATGSAKVSEDSIASIEELAAFLNEHKDTTAEIQGHTDNTGSDKVNRELSQKRADSVKAYLIEKLGINATRLTSYGYGETKPMAENTTSEGRRENRRVVAEITEK